MTTIVMQDDIIWMDTLATLSSAEGKFKSQVRKYRIDQYEQKIILVSGSYLTLFSPIINELMYYNNDKSKKQIKEKYLWISRPIFGDALIDDLSSTIMIIDYKDNTIQIWSRTKEEKLFGYHITTKLILDEPIKKNKLYAIGSGSDHITDNFKIVSPDSVPKAMFEALLRDDATNNDILEINLSFLRMIYRNIMNNFCENTGDVLQLKNKLENFKTTQVTY